MIFSEDAILLSFFNRYDDEEELKEAVIKYSQGGTLAVNRPAAVDSTKGAITDIDEVSLPMCLIQCGNIVNQPNRQCD